MLRRWRRSSSFAASVLVLSAWGGFWKGFNTKIAKFTKITKQVLGRFARSAMFGFCVNFADFVDFVLNLANHDWSRTTRVVHFE